MRDGKLEEPYALWILPPNSESAQPSVFSFLNEDVTPEMQPLSEEFYDRELIGAIPLQIPKRWPEMVTGEMTKLLRARGL